MKSILNNRYFLLGIILVIGIVLGWSIKPSGNRTFQPSRQESANQSNHQIIKSSDHQIIKSSDHQLWTCSMHPQIREDHPGKCPICGMDLIPLNSEENQGAVGPDEIKMSEVSMKLAQVEITRVEKVTPVKEVYMPGKVMADERRMAVISSRFAGRIEKLFINFTGQYVRKGQRLAVIYSPALVTAQKELFEAKKNNDTNPSFYNAAVNKLKLWDLSDAQIQGILDKGEPQFHFDILATQSGTVTKKIVTLGEYVKEGSELFEVANLNRVWVMFDAYEIDLPWINSGDKIHFTIGSMPGREFTSTVTFIDPVINARTRTTAVRTEIDNPGGNLKPEMFATGILHAVLPGKKESLVIPKTSILWTGKRAVVYVLKPGSDYIFSYRDITLGPEAGDYYVVANGLSEGEEVATNGVFKIDAAAQLQGKKSMMSPGPATLEGGMSSPLDLELSDKNSGDHPALKPGSLTSTPENKAPGMSTAQRFRKQLTSVYDEYLDLKDALFASDLNKSKSAVSTIKKLLDDVDMTLLKGEAHVQWMKSLGDIKSGLDGIDQSSTLDTARESFAGLSSSLAAAIKSFGLADRTAYYQFCPMANDNKGAYWLSQFKEIKNPYMGSKMPTCGNTEEIIK